MAAFAGIRDLRELHARQLKPLLKDPKGREAVLGEADALAAEQAQARAAGQGGLPAAKVMARLKAAARPPKQRQAADRTYEIGTGVVHERRKGRRVSLEFDIDLPDEALRTAVDAWLRDRGKAKAGN